MSVHGPGRMRVGPNSPVTGAHPSVMTRAGWHTKRGRGPQPGRPRPPRPPTPQETRQRFKVQALKKLQEVEDEALGFLNFTHDAIQWRRNQQVWIRLQIQRPSRTMVEIVTTLGTPEPMSHQELFSLMVAMYWMLKQRVCENMCIRWTWKREDQMHTFNWQAILMVPIAAGRRPMRTSAGRSGDYYYMWFAGMPEVLRHFQQTLFHACDPISGDATCFLYTLLLTLPSVRQY